MSDHDHVGRQLEHASHGGQAQEEARQWGKEEDERKQWDGGVHLAGDKEDQTGERSPRIYKRSVMWVHCR